LATVLQLGLAGRLFYLHLEQAMERTHFVQARGSSPWLQQCNHGVKWPAPGRCDCSTSQGLDLLHLFSIWRCAWGWEVEQGSMPCRSLWGAPLGPTLVERASAPTAQLQACVYVCAYLQLPFQLGEVLERMLDCLVRVRKIFVTHAS